MSDLSFGDTISPEYVLYSLSFEMFPNSVN